MLKVFFGDRYIAFSNSYNECMAAANGMVYVPHTPREVAAIISYFEHSEQKSVAIYTEGESENEVFNSFCKHFSLVEAAGGLTQNAQGDVLMIFRFNRWDLPKGKREDKESMEETALREVEEECGIAGLSLYPLITKTYHTYRQGSQNLLKCTCWYSLYYGGSCTPTPQLEEGIEKAEWVPASVLPEYVNSCFASTREVFYASGLVNEAGRL